MNRTVVRGLVPLAALAALTALTACSTTVTGTGRPAAAASSGAAPSPTGSFDASGDPHDVWNAAVEATVAREGTVVVDGVVSGAGIGGAKITGIYSVDDDGNPVADIAIDTPKGNSLTIVATGGKAWVKATTETYIEYGYDAAVAEQAGADNVQLTDDDSGLDVYAALDSLLALCGPDDEDPASVDADGSYEGDDAVVVTDEKYDTDTYLSPADGSVIASVYDDETITFAYREGTTEVDAPTENLSTVDGI